MVGTENTKVLNPKVFSFRLSHCLHGVGIMLLRETDTHKDNWREMNDFEKQTRLFEVNS